jgi:hypothetical protein
VERTAERVWLRLSADPERVAALARLCAAEVACCPSAWFHLEIGNDQVLVTVSAPGAPELLGALFPSASAFPAA